MNALELKRIIRSGLKNFSRNGFVTFASILIMTITVSIVLSLLFLQAILNFSLTEIENKVDIKVYTTEDADELSVLSLKNELQQLPEVAQVTYKTKEDELELFKERHKNDVAELRALAEVGENPFTASLGIKAVSPSQYDGIASFLEQRQSIDISSGEKTVIDNINYYRNKVVIDKLIRIIQGSRLLGLAITLVFMTISILVVFTTVRLAIFSSKEEIQVMRLVGAGHRYIQGPFVVEGMLYGLLSAFISVILFYPLTLWLGKNMTNYLALNTFQYYISNFFQIVIIALIVGLVLGSVSSLLAVKRHLGK